MILDSKVTYTLKAIPCNAKSSQMRRRVISSRDSSSSYSSTSANSAPDMYDSTTPDSDMDYFEDSNNDDPDLDPTLASDPWAPPPGNWLVNMFRGENPESDPWGWNATMQRGQLTKTWDGRVIATWTTRRSYIAASILLSTGIALAALLSDGFDFQTMQAIGIAVYSVAMVVGVGVGSVLALHLR
ncbi:hypothetical protein VTL71DRAFT_10231, partial [Oculimacula yallundae]